MTRFIDIGEGSGQLRLTLRPDDGTRCARVQITTRPHGYGPNVNNAIDLLRLARDFTTACEELAWELWDGLPRPAQPAPADGEPQLELFEETNAS